MSWIIAILLACAQEESVEKLIEQLSAEKIEVREEAHRKLEAIGRRAVPALEKAARHPDGEVASRARRLLLRIPIREHLTPVLISQVQDIYERLSDGEWKAVFLELASDLRQPDERRRYPGVRAEDLSFMAPLAVQRATSEADCIAVCEAVGRCRLRSALPEVAKLVTSDLVMVRANAAAAIRDVGERSYAAELRPLLQDRHAVVRSVAAHALGRLRDRESVPELVKLLRDSSKDVRWWTLRALADLEAKEALNDVARLESDPDESVRIEAARTALVLKKP